MELHSVGVAARGSGGPPEMPKRTKPQPNLKPNHKTVTLTQLYVTPGAKSPARVRFAQAAFLHSAELAALERAAPPLHRVVTTEISFSNAFIAQFQLQRPLSQAARQDAAFCDAAIRPNLLLAQRLEQLQPSSSG